MTLIDELKVINYSIIDCMKTKGISLKKNMLIKEILKDEACFFKMEKKEAIVVLKNLKYLLQNTKSYVKLIIVN